MRETLGESYFDYLSALPDLVLLMDEAHRYRAKAGMKTIAELKSRARTRIDRNAEIRRRELEAIRERHLRIWPRQRHG